MSLAHVAVMPSVPDLKGGRTARRRLAENYIADHLPGFLRQRIFSKWFKSQWSHASFNNFSTGRLPIDEPSTS